MGLGREEELIQVLEKKSLNCSNLKRINASSRDGNESRDGFNGDDDDKDERSFVPLGFHLLILRTNPIIAAGVMRGGGTEGLDPSDHISFFGVGKKRRGEGERKTNDVAAALPLVAEYERDCRRREREALLLPRHRRRRRRRC